MFFDKQKPKVISLDDLYAPVYLEKRNYYLRHLDMYYSKHWDYPKVDGVPQVTMNYCKRFIDKINSFLFGKSWTVEFYDEEESVKDELHDIMIKVWEIWNNRKKLSMQIGKMGLITGDVFILVAVDEMQIKLNDNGEFISELVKPEDRKIRIIPLDSTTVFPFWNPYNKEELVRIDITYPVPKEYSVNNTVYVVEEYYQQSITKDTIKEFRNGVEISPPRQNPLGFIPVVHIKNFDMANKFYGRSEIEDIVELNKEYNEKATDISEVLSYYGQPITIAQGVSASTIQPEERIWSNIPPTAKIYNLELKSDLSSATNYIAQLKQAMHEISGVPEASLGKMQPISNTSAVALHLQYMPLMEVTEEKRIVYGDGLQKVNEMIFKIMENRAMINTSVFSKMKYPYKVKIKFESPLPKDQIAELQQAQLMVNMGLESKIGALKNLQVENPELKLKEIYESKIADAKMQKEISDITNPAESIGLKNGKTNEKTDKKVISGFESNNGTNKKYNDLKEK